MSPKVKDVVTGLRNLNNLERRELAILLNRGRSGFEAAGVRRIEESLEIAMEVHTAPISGGGCACCGGSR